MFDQPTPTVSELVSAIKENLEEQFHDVMVEGEISNLTSSGAGHWYFTLSDSEASLSCALFKGDALRNPQIRQLKDGDKVIILGAISVYQKRGTFQLLGKKIIPSGQGHLKLKFEKLKNKLAAEGLFDIAVKKKLPVFPKKIAVITALKAAALADFINVIERRSAWYEIFIVPAIVQGDGAPTTLIAALERAQNIEGIELIVITRGGGSMEDLWCFNDENLVRKIADCKIPTISAVGHQVDFTLCDYAADFRAETPTAAAEIISQPQTELKRRIENSTRQLNAQLKNMATKLVTQKDRIHPQKLLLLLQNQMMQKKSRLERFKNLDDRLDRLKFFELSQRVDESEVRLIKRIETMQTELEHRLNLSYQVLQAVGPQSILRRGYTYLSGEGEKVITSATKFQQMTSDKYKLHFYDGVVHVSKEKK